MVTNLAAEVFSISFKNTHNLTLWLWRICARAWAGVQVPMELGQGSPCCSHTDLSGQLQGHTHTVLSLLR